MKKKKKKKKKDGEQEKEEKSIHSTAIVDGVEQPVANYVMEPIGIFLGRGKNPNLGKIKKELYQKILLLILVKKHLFQSYQIFIKTINEVK